jgi:hypothetical protein
MGFFSLNRSISLDLLTRTNMLKSNGVTTPMLPSDKLSLAGGMPLSPEDFTHY